jgi:hypothetical protein
LETRRLHTLPREKAVDRLAMNAEDAADADSIEPTVVDQPPDGLGVHAQLIRYLANTDEPGLSTCRRQTSPKPCRFSGHAHEPFEPVSRTGGPTTAESAG